MNPLLTIAQLSPPSGGSLSDALTKTPDAIGQFGVAFYGNLVPHLLFAGSTLKGDWLKPFIFPTGIVAIGDPDFSGPDADRLTIYINGGKANWDNPGDGLVTACNLSANRLSSGSGFNCAVMKIGEALTDPVIVSGGTGYAEGDLLMVNGGTIATTIYGYVRVTEVYDGAIVAVVIHNSGEYSTAPTGICSVTTVTGIGESATFTFTAIPKAVRAMADNAASFLHSKAGNMVGLLPAYTCIVVNTDATYNKGVTICSPWLAGYDSTNGSWVFFERDGTTHFPKFIEGALTPASPGWMNALHINHHTGVVTINDLRGATVDAISAWRTATDARLNLLEAP